jgi:hypothetical protein
VYSVVKSEVRAACMRMDFRLRQRLDACKCARAAGILCAPYSLRVWVADGENSSNKILSRTTGTHVLESFNRLCALSAPQDAAEVCCLDLPTGEGLKTIGEASQVHLESRARGTRSVILPGLPI